MIHAAFSPSTRRKRTRPFFGFDQVPHLLMAVGEHAFQFAANKPDAEPPLNHSRGNRICDLVFQQGSALTIVEKAVAVILRGERSYFLAICKQMRRLIFRVAHRMDEAIGGYPRLRIAGIGDRRHLPA
jgi:hypothetical protein